MTTLIGPFGATFIAAVVVISTLGCNVAGTLAMSRACYAMAVDGLFFRSVAAVHPDVPHAARRHRLHLHLVGAAGRQRQLRSVVHLRDVRLGAVQHARWRGDFPAAPDARGAAAPLQDVGLSVGARVVRRRLRTAGRQHVDGAARRVADGPWPGRHWPAGVLVLEQPADQSRCNRQSSMKIAVLGSGAVGGYYGALLARAGHDVVFIARGAHLDAIRSQGLRVRGPLGDWQIRARAEHDTAVGRPRGSGAVCSEDLRQRLGAAAPGSAGRNVDDVLTLQNGVDSPDAVAAVVGEKARALAAPHTSRRRCRRPA